MRNVLCLIAVIFSTCWASQSAMGQQRLQVHNTMSEGVYMWIKSEAVPETHWQRHFIRKNEKFSIRLVSPDRFQVVIEDPQGRQFSAGLLALKEMMKGNPKAVLTLDGVFETRTASVMTWSNAHQAWIIQECNQPERTAVRFKIRVNSQLHYQPILAEPIN